MNALEILNSVSKPLKKSSYKDFFRGFHTLKGLSKFYGFNDLSSQIHSLENDLKIAKDSNLSKKEFKLVLEKLIYEMENYLGVYLVLADEVYKIGFIERETWTSMKYEEVKINETIEIPLGQFEVTMREMEDFLVKKENKVLLEKIRNLNKVEFKSVCKNFSKLVKNLEALLDKEISLEVVGDQLLIDRDVHMSLKECLTHLIQNASDHGIEKYGRINIELKSIEGFFEISITDNGKGIDPKIVLNKAIESKIISEEEAEKLNTKEILELIFKPNFSTKKRSD